MLRIGVIGVGYLGRHHARVFSEIEDVELVAVADVDHKRAEEIAKAYNCAAYSDYKEIFDKVDAVSIVTPTTTHYDIALDCLRNGKDLFIEKPITVTVEEADRLIEEAEKEERIIQVGHIERYNPAIIAIEEMIERPKFMESERLSPFLGRGIDVDVTLDLMIHDIDIIMALSKSRVKAIKAIGAKVLTDNLDVAKAWLEMEDGSSALVTASRLSSEKKRTLKIFQDSGFFVVDYQAGEILTHSRNSEGEIKHGKIKPPKAEPLKEELKDFVRSVKNRKRPRVTAEDGREALKVALYISRRIKETL